MSINHFVNPAELHQQVASLNFLPKTSPSFDRPHNVQPKHSIFRPFVYRPQ